MEELTGILVDVRREDPRTSAVFLVISVNGKELQYMGESRMITNAITDGGFNKGDKIFVQVEGGLLCSFGHLE